MLPAVLGEVDLVRRAGGVPGEVLGGPADLQELLLDLTARPRVDDEGVGRRVPDQQRLDALVVRAPGRAPAGSEERRISMPSSSRSITSRP